MSPPFTAEQFFAVFARYNLAVWPMQAVLSLRGLAASVRALLPRRGSDRLIAGVLSFLWLWIAQDYGLVVAGAMAFGLAIHGRAARAHTPAARAA